MSWDGDFDPQRYYNWARSPFGRLKLRESTTEMRQKNKHNVVKKTCCPDCFKLFLPGKQMIKHKKEVHRG